MGASFNLSIRRTALQNKDISALRLAAAAWWSLTCTTPSGVNISPNFAFSGTAIPLLLGRLAQSTMTLTSTAHTSPLLQVVSQLSF